MDARAEQPRVGEIVGREQELATLRRFLEGGTERQALLISGEPGIGKTKLWEAAIEFARRRDCLVLSARPSEAEAHLSLSALADLLEDADPQVLRLPPPQRRALQVAMLREEPGEDVIDPRAIGAGLLSVLRELARLQPVVVAVDDVQWLDASSASALAFAGRRAHHSQVVFLVTERVGLSSPLVGALGAGDLARIELRGLSLGATRSILRERIGLEPSRAVSRRIFDATRGNPLFVLEIGRALARRGESVSPAESLPVPDDLQSIVRERVRKLPAATQELLLSAALLAQPRADTLRSVVGRAVAEELEPAEQHGIAGLRSGSVGFFHPLYAEAVVGLATEAERRRVHRRLAASAARSEERARHLALSTEGPDESVAEVVHAAARDVFARGAVAAAAELAELAVALGVPTSPAHPLRLVELGGFLQSAGEPARVRELFVSIDDVSSWPLTAQAQARGLQLVASYWTADPRSAAAMGERMLLQEPADEVKATVHAHLSAIYEFDLERAAAHSAAALALFESVGDGADPDAHGLALVMHLRNQVHRGLGLRRDLVEQLLLLDERSPARRRHPLYVLGMLFKHVDDVDSSRERLSQELAHAVDLGDEMAQIVALMHLGLTECWAGNLRLALQHCEKADRMAEELGESRAGSLGARAIVEAHLGDLEATAAVAEQTLRVREPTPGAPHWIYAEAALGHALLAAGDAAGARMHLTTALREMDAGGHREPGIFRVHGNAAECAVAVGDLDAAARIADELAGHAQRTGHRWSGATAARIRALVSAACGDLDAALAMAEQAMSEYDRLPLRFERARGLLAAGSVQRRAKQWARARKTLTDAASEFDEIGASAWAARARSELGRVGGRRRVEGALTPAETRVAELAAAGLPNKEIAATLFVSVYTIERHLKHAYAKLGVRSRGQLAQRLRPVDPP